MRIHRILIVMAASSVASTCGAVDGPPVGGPPGAGPASAVVAGVEGPALRDLAGEVLARNPGLAALSAEARAVAARAPQVRSLPDPTASMTAYLLTPETRVGPQQAAVSLAQRLPRLAKLRLRERAALLEALAARARVEATAVTLVTRLRTLYQELSFLDRQQTIVEQDRATLGHYEELAQARYASGVGLGQAVVKIQAEITRASARLLDIAERRTTLIAEINALCDRPAGSTVVLDPVTAPADTPLDAELLEQRALASRPELIGARAVIDAAAAGIELAKKDSSPDLTLGIAYVLVGERNDRAGRAAPPQGNGDDTLAVTAGINLPIRRRRLAAVVDEAARRRLAAEEMHRALTTDIRREVGDLAHRIPLLREQLDLFRDVLAIQAEESLRSAEAAYASGTARSLDLLDAVRVLLDVRIATERTRTDLAVAVARLEGAVAGPISPRRTATDGNGGAS